MLATIPVELIENGQRLRDLSEATVEALMNSIGDVGLLNPITVYRRKLFNGGNQVEGYGLVAGLHRKTACERLGLVEIDPGLGEVVLRALQRVLHVFVGFDVAKTLRNVVHRCF